MGCGICAQGIRSFTEEEKEKRKRSIPGNLRERHSLSSRTDGRMVDVTRVVKRAENPQGIGMSLPISSYTQGRWAST